MWPDQGWAEILQVTQLHLGLAVWTCFVHEWVVNLRDFLCHIFEEFAGMQARFLLARLNPSVTHNRSADATAAGSEIIFSEDVALDVFLDHLAKLAVAE